MPQSNCRVKVKTQLEPKTNHRGREDVSSARVVEDGFSQLAFAIDNIQPYIHQRS